MAFYFMPCKGARSSIRLQRGSVPPVIVTQVPTDPRPPSAAPARTVGWASHLRRHLRWVIGIKLLLIYLLFSLFFSSSHRPDIDAASVSDRLQLSR